MFILQIAKVVLKSLGRGWSLFRIPLGFLLLSLCFLLLLLFDILLLPLFLLRLLVGQFVVDEIVKSNHRPDHAGDVHHQHLVVGVHLQTLN